MAKAEKIDHYNVYRLLSYLQRGLSRFTYPSRVALILVPEFNSEPIVYDPQDLLRDNQSAIHEHFVQVESWKDSGIVPMWPRIGMSMNVGGLPVQNLISWGSRSAALPYQMWFTEHHGAICSKGPIERWLQQACTLLNNDTATSNTSYTSSAALALERHAVYSVYHHISSSLEGILSQRPKLNVLAILECITALSLLTEEGNKTTGQLLFIEPQEGGINVIWPFDSIDLPKIYNYKHLRKLLQLTIDPTLVLISDGDSVLGVSEMGELPAASILATFNSGISRVYLGNSLVCTINLGHISGRSLEPDSHHVQTLLSYQGLSSENLESMIRMLSTIISDAHNRHYGCTLIVDCSPEVSPLPGQRLQKAIPASPSTMPLICAMARIDGALHIGVNYTVYAFACLLDGKALSVEERSRGARYNSAMRFSAEHNNVLAIVVSEDGPITIFVGGQVYPAVRQMKMIDSVNTDPPTLRSWLANNLNT